MREGGLEPTAVGLESGPEGQKDLQGPRRGDSMRQRAVNGVRARSQGTGKAIPGGERGEERRRGEEESPSGRRTVGLSAGEQSDHRGEAGAADNAHPRVVCEPVSTASSA